MRLRDDVNALGGLAATHELLRRGATNRGLTAAVRCGVLLRVRQGWYALPETKSDLVRAARVGGRLTALSAAANLPTRSGGPLWVMPDERLHVSVPSNGCRLRTPANPRIRLARSPRPGVCIHWNDRPDGDRFFVTPGQMVRDVIACSGTEASITVIESALHRAALPWGDWLALLDTLPIEDRTAFRMVDGIPESGTESLYRHRMRRHRVPMRQQVQIAGVGRVDFLIGRRLIIEIDGYGYHSDPERFERDRQRDAILSRLGYRVLRFSYKQVLYRWHEVEAATLAALARGDHH